MKSYFETKTVIDESTLTAQQIMSILESAAGGDTSRWEVSTEQLAERFSAVWMIARCVVNLDKPITGPGELICRTCHRGFNGILAFRDFDLLFDGEKIGTVVQAWIISDIATRKMLRPENIPGFVLPDSEDPRDTLISKLKAPKELTRVGSYTVLESDIDANGHMNNSRYLSAAQSLLGEDFKVSGFQVGFLKESMLGDNITLYRADTDGGIHIRGCHDNGTACFDVLFFTENTAI